MKKLLMILMLFTIMLCNVPNDIIVLRKIMTQYINQEDEYKILNQKYIECRENYIKLEYENRLLKQKNIQINNALNTYKHMFKLLDIKPKY